MSIENKTQIIAHSSLAEYEFDGDDLDRYYLPARGLADAPSLFIKHGRAPVVIVPRHEEIRKQASFYRHSLLDGQNGVRLIETPDSKYLMDGDIADNLEILKELSEINRSGGMEIYPYAVTDEFLSWARPLIESGAVLIGDKKKYLDPKWWGHKAGLHRWIDNLQVSSFSEDAGIPIARGYVAKNKDEMLRACKLLETYRVILKPYILSGGFEMKPCRTKEEVESYRIPLMPSGIGKDNELMPVAVEELLNIDKDERGEKVYSMQFVADSLVGSLTRQIVHNSTNWAGNQVPSGAGERFEQASEHIVRKFLRYAQPKGPGGVDIASVDGKPIILEINGGRPTGAHNPKMFKLIFAPSAQAVIFEKEDHTGLIGIDVETAWDRLNREIYDSKSLAFDRNTQYGVYPLVWLKNMWTMLIAFNDTPESTRALLEEAKKLLYS